MSRVCPECLKKIDDDDRKFCPFCGEPLDPHLKIMKQMDTIVKEYKSADRPAPPPKKKPVQPAKPAQPVAKYDDDEYIAPISRPKKKNTGTIVVVIAVIVIVALYFLFLHH